MIKQHRKRLDKVKLIENLKSAVFEWAEKLKVKPKEIHIRPMKNKWASLSAKGRLSFSTELLDMNKSFRNYVIIHELLHIKVPNHGKLFKSLMYAFLPEWEKYSKCIIIDK